MAAILFKLLFHPGFYLFFPTMAGPDPVLPGPTRGAGARQAGDHGYVVESKNRHDALKCSAPPQPLPS
ncbi:hypothetical protein CFR72_00045 [Gluconacetobacter entanii]|uniref:Secreted protein n=1 Tax=Gluconacetobacter entanii TaxID=108528 RepID=A0A318Q1U1_9PROT|nr:hypothetical protein CFR72_00045 [Gluconacetobacter entanii]